RESIMSAVLISYVFFFSSRRRHTRFSRDWSSDVCSSDLRRCEWLQTRRCALESRYGCNARSLFRGTRRCRGQIQAETPASHPPRSEERRVGKECRSRWATEHENKQNSKRSVTKATIHGNN